MPNLNLNANELATVLHALRIFQDGVIDEAGACDHFEDGVRPLANGEVDALCERINLPAEVERNDFLRKLCIRCVGRMEQLGVRGAKSLDAAAMHFFTGAGIALSLSGNEVAAKWVAGFCEFRIQFRGYSTVKAEAEQK